MLIGPAGFMGGTIMGTSRSGLYLNTKGAWNTVSNFALVHAVEGKFVQAQKPRRLRLDSGGHGQKGMDLLDKYGIKYTIVKIYDNGVRVGNVPDHKQRKKRVNIGQAWFPQSWSERKIKKAGEFVAKLKKNHHIQDGSTMYGNYHGVRVGVKKTNGKIATIFPDSVQPCKRRK